MLTAPPVAWLLRLTWATLPLTVGEAVADALADHGSATSTVAAALAWLAWLVGLVALLVVRPSSLTALRLVAPWALGVAAWAILDADAGAAAAVRWLVAAAVPAGLAFLPQIGEWLVNGPSYGDERRFPLRAPGALLAGPLLLAGAAVVPAVAAGPLLLAAEAWVAGALALVVGWPLAFVLARALDALSYRWFVFVPAGVVLKDHVTLAETVLFRRVDIASLGPAPAGSDALDLTARSFGLALELTLRGPYDLHRVVPGERLAELGSSSVLLFTPTRPGAVLDLAARRRLPVG